MRSYAIEEDNIFRSIRYVVIMTSIGHRCGYVGVDKNHPLYGVEYNSNLPVNLFSLWEKIKQGPIGKRSIIDVACCDQENPSVGILFDVHGGITYSGPNSDGYPVSSPEELWFFGFDCAHAKDRHNPKSREYVENECKSLIYQLLIVKEGA